MSVSIPLGDNKDMSLIDNIILFGHPCPPSQLLINVHVCP